MKLTANVLMCALLLAADARGDASLTFHVTDTDGQALPCRVHLRDEAGQPAPAGELPRRADHLAFDGERTVSLPAGTYTYAIERSPEWERVEGEVTLRDGDRKQIPVTLQRIADLSEQGWYSGDLHIHRELEDIEQLIRSSDLDIAPVITWWNNRNLWSEERLPLDPLVTFDAGKRHYRVLSGEDEREGGALLYFGMKRPIDITGASREFPSPMTFVEQARGENPSLHLDIEKPFWWDVPVWLALAKPDTIGLANNHMCRASMFETEAWGRPRDAARLPAPRGNGYWTQEIYYHILNAGLRLPPSAGSASGVLPNPVGYNRVYVHLDGPLTWNDWWDGLRAGRSFVTNGPMLVCRANGELPGHVFQSDAPLKINIEATLTTLDRVPQLEVIRNGEVVRTVDGTDAHMQQISTDIEFTESGWFLVRAITDNPRTFRFASTAPFYVEIGDTPRRISRASAQFFVDWIDERMQRIPDKLTDAEQLKDVLNYQEAARAFWQRQVEQATAP